MKLKKIHFGVAPVVVVSSFPTPVNFIPNNLFFPSLSLLFQTIMAPTRSVGQANFISLSSQSIGSRGSSIVHQLASRSITGNGLGIHVHRHVGFKLHLVWHVLDKHNNKSVKWFERIFPNFDDLYNFFKHLKDGAFEGLCDSVCDHFMKWMDDKINSCNLEYSKQDQLRLSIFLPSTVRNKIEITLNVYALCPPLTGLEPLYGIEIPISIISYDIVTCSIVHNFKLLTFKLYTS